MILALLLLLPMNLLLPLQNCRCNRMGEVKGRETGRQKISKMDDPFKKRTLFCPGRGQNLYAERIPSEN